uniref:Uncharacterized protein n=1 Tax=Colletotrichum fructicola (strain Nara gc5) TaxID=1213859 RepID=L2G926_COLFN
MLHLSEVQIARYMTTLYSPFSEHQAWSYIRQHMNDSMTRACLISRAIIDLLVHRIFVFEAWQGFSVDADRQIGEIRYEMNNLPAGQGGALQVCIDRVAAIVNSCINHERYDAYRSHRIEYFQAELREMLAPLMLPESEGGPNLDDADDALRDMIEKAWSISAKMFTSRCTFEFRFPDAGARFSTQTMVGVAPNIDPHILQAEHWRVHGLAIALSILSLLHLRDLHGLIPTFTADRNLLGLGALYDHEVHEIYDFRFPVFATDHSLVINDEQADGLLGNNQGEEEKEEEEAAILIGIAVWVERVWGQTHLVSGW